jgi:hypothetical protein
MSKRVEVTEDYVFRPPSPGLFEGYVMVGTTGFPVVQEAGKLYAIVPERQYEMAAKAFGEVSSSARFAELFAADLALALSTL